MLPYHTNVRGSCHDFAPCLLPARHPGIPVALHHVALRLAQPIYQITPEASRTRAPQMQAQMLHRTQTLRGAHSTTSLRCV